MNVLNKSLKIAGAAVLFFAACAGTWAQTDAPPPPPPGGPGFAHGAHRPFGPDDALGFVGFEERLGGKTVTGAPFSASVSTTTTQVLPDGNQIQRTTTGTFARDSQGRTRSDMTLSAIGPWASSGKTPPHISTITDPVGGAQYMLDSNRKIAHKTQFRVRGQQRANAANRPRPNIANEKNVTTSSLGTQIIGGVSAEGTLYTRTIPANTIGNAKPLVITMERWYSPDLQTVVMTKRSDPRTGTRVFQLADISRTEPDASLFQVPSDYSVKQGGPRGAARAWRGGGQTPPLPPPDGGPDTN